MTSKGEQATRMKTAGLSNRQIAIAMDMPEASVRRLRSEYRAQKARPIGEAVRDAEETMERVMPGVVGTFYEMRAGQTYGTLGEAPRERDKPRRHIIIPDTQCKPGVPLDHLLWAGRYIAEQRPDTLIHIGDNWDYPSLSSYEKRGSHYFEGKRLIEDKAAGDQGIELLEEGMQSNGSFAPDKHFTEGNHCDRLTRFFNENPHLIGGFPHPRTFLGSLGWTVHPYLKPVELDGVSYCHYFYNPGTGRAYAGSVDNMLRTIGHSFTMGHQQGKRIGSRELSNGTTQRGCVIGSFYQHDEDYKGPQGNSHWRGIIVCNEVADGNYDIVEVSMSYLKKKFS